MYPVRQKALQKTWKKISRTQSVDPNREKCQCKTIVLMNVRCFEITTKLFMAKYQYQTFVGQNRKTDSNVVTITIACYSSFPSLRVENSVTLSDTKIISTVFRVAVTVYARTDVDDTSNIVVR